MKRIGIYGGTFNPPHLGHVRGAKFAMSSLKLEKLLVIPTNISPHKQLPADTPTPQQRYDMTKLAFSCISGVEVSDLELQRQGASYTYETVDAVKGMYPDAEIVLFMGTDMFLSFLEWKEPERILKNASLAVFYRGEKGEKEAIDKQTQVLKQMGATVYLVNNPITTISSTDLRRLIAFDCASEFLPEEVKNYICTQKLYGIGKPRKQLPMEQLEQEVISLLKPNRVAHVLGCREAAMELAKRWDADPVDAARAGLLHDITKALDGPLQLTLCREYGILLDNFSMANPKTLHALTGSLVAERIFGENPRVVAAICSHTTGKANMNVLEKIIYVADYMEPNRAFPGVEELRHLAYTDLDQALRWGLENTLAMLKQQGSEISPASQEALAYLKS